VRGRGRCGQRCRGRGEEKINCCKYYTLSGLAYTVYKRMRGVEREEKEEVEKGMCCIRRLAQLLVIS
jgi:hypothetical protein